MLYVCLQYRGKRNLSRNAHEICFGDFNLFFFSVYLLSSEPGPCLVSIQSLTVKQSKQIASFICNDLNTNEKR